MRALFAAIFLFIAASATPAPAQVLERPDTGLKMCSPFVPNMWRTTMMVQPSWTIADCVALARALSATHVQLGCIFEVPRPGGQRFSLGRRPFAVTTAPTTLNVPTDNCRWAL